MTSPAKRAESIIAQFGKGTGYYDKAFDAQKELLKEALLDIGTDLLGQAMRERVHLDDAPHGAQGRKKSTLLALGRAASPTASPSLRARITGSKPALPPPSHPDIIVSSQLEAKLEMTEC